jgi:hypothetical protein
LATEGRERRRRRRSRRRMKRSRSALLCFGSGGRRGREFYLRAVRE